MRKPKKLSNYAAQSGAVLITGLVFMVVLTMFVLALVRGGTLEERMARNARDQQVAREAAEAMLRDAETSFAQAPFDPYDATRFSPDCALGLCFKPVAAKAWNKIDWESTAVTRGFVNATSNIDGVSVQPRYVLEIMERPSRPNSSQPCSLGLARITARAVGSGGAIALIQSYVRFRVYSNICE